MKRKRSEESLGKMMRLYGWKADKGRDRGYMSCPNCHKAITKCPYCKGDTLLPKAKTRLDFTISFKWTEIECKQGAESWALNDFTEAQENIIENVKIGGTHWLFLEIGDGRAPNGREAYLVDMFMFKKIRDKEYEADRKSVRFRSTEKSRMKEAKEVFTGHELVWSTGEGWTIPDGHIFWANDLDSDIEKIHDMAVITPIKETINNDKREPSFAPARPEMLE